MKKEIIGQMIPNHKGRKGDFKARQFTNTVRVMVGKSRNEKMKLNLF